MTLFIVQESKYMPSGFTVKGRALHRCSWRWLIRTHPLAWIQI